MKELLLSILLSATVGMRSSFFSTKNFILPLFLLFFISIHVNAQLVKCSSVSFATVTNYATGRSNPSYVGTADLNGDGKLDLVVPIGNPDGQGGSVGVSLGNGDGTFQPQVIYPAGNEYGMGIFWMAIADLNGDGKLDLATANSGTNDVSVLLGNGDGTFQGPVLYATGSAPWSVAIGDFNGDRKPDLVTANSGSDNVSVLLGNGDGTFQAPLTYATGSQPTSVAIGDFNGDGKPDLAVANSHNWNVSVLLGKGDGTFQTQVTYASGTVTYEPGPWSVAIGDFNGDGKLDLATTNPVSKTINVSQASVSILLGNGDGTFQPQIFSQAVDGSRFLAIGDFNGDGKPDLVTTSYYSYLSILLGNGDGTFQKQVSYDPGEEHVSVTVGDFNGDGRLDVATGKSGSVYPDSVSVLLNNCTASPQCLLSVTAGPNQKVFGYAPAQCKTNTATVTGGTAPFTYHWTLNRPLLTNFINSSGNETMTGANTATVTVCLLQKAILCVTVTDAKGCTASSCAMFTEDVKCSSVSFATATNYATDNGNPDCLAIADLNGDGKLDLVVPGSNVNNEGSSVGVLLGNGDGTFQPQVPYSAGYEYGMGILWVAIGDLNGDGKLDLVTANSGTNDVSVLLGNGDGTFQGPVLYATGSAPWSVAIGDFNGDRKPDLVTTNSGSDNVSVLLGNGDGTFHAPPPTGDIQGNGGVTIPATALTYATGSQPTSVAIGDFNGDGKPDLAIANSHNWNVSVLLGNGDGTFKTQVTYASGHVTFQPGPYSVAIGDFNGDGKPDLATTNGVSATNGSVGTVSILLGNGDGTFQPQIISEAVAGSQFLAISDFNGDGKPDLATDYLHFSIVLGNGDGTFQKPVSYDPGNTHVGSPAVGDFNGDGRLDVATAGRDNGFPFDGAVSVLLNNCTASCNLSVTAGPDVSTFYGYTGDQQVTRTAIVTGGTAPYTYSWTIGRPLKCNVITSSGDEIFSGGSCTNTACPTNGTLTGTATCSGSATVTLRLVDTTNVCVTVTDANGCVATSCFRVMAEDVRCFAGNSNNSKVKVCHHTGSSSNPWVQICIADDAVSAHLANNPGDYLGSCAASVADLGNLTAEETSKSGFNIYPNPGNGDFIVSLNLPDADMKNGIIQVININGQIIKRMNINEQRTLNINLKESGVYFVRLLTNTQTLTKKLTVIH